MGNFPGWRCAISTRACPWRARRPRSGPRSLIVRRDASGPRARAPVFKPRVPGRSTTHERTRRQGTRTHSPAMTARARTSRPDAAVA
jgi:hypothetical protein